MVSGNPASDRLGRTRQSGRRATVDAVLATSRDQAGEIPSVDMAFQRGIIIKTLFPSPSFRQCDVETSYLERSCTSSATSMSPSYNLMAGQAGEQSSQIDLVLSEVRRLEEVAKRNEDELVRLDNTNSSGNGSNQHPQLKDDVVIKSEISQLKQRLAGTDHELHKTNLKLRCGVNEASKRSLYVTA